MNLKNAHIHYNENYIEMHVVFCNKIGCDESNNSSFTAIYTYIFHGKLQFSKSPCYDNTQ